MDESKQAPVANEIEAPPAAASHIRMRHPDKDASFSFAEVQADGALMVPMELLEQAQAHGLYICHDDAHEAEGKVPLQPPTSETVVTTASTTEEPVEENSPENDAPKEGTDDKVSSRRRPKS